MKLSKMFADIVSRSSFVRSVKRAVMAVCAVALAFAAQAARETPWHAIVTPGQVQAGEVTPEQAQTAVENWINGGPERMGARFGSSQAESMDTDRNEAGRALFHAVNLEGGGFVVVSGDTRLAPIVAFSDRGRYDGNAASPLYALLHKNLTGAVAALEDSAAASGLLAAGEGDTDPYAEAMAEWNALLYGSSATPLLGDTGVESISDVRVPQLLKTEWGQEGGWSNGGYGPDYLPVFDYYIYSNLGVDMGAIVEDDNNIPCGCVATAGAQLMYFWKFPTASIPQFSNTCSYQEVSRTCSSIAGTFDWNNMFEVWELAPDYPGDPSYDPTDVQRKAVGKLAWNVAVALGMKFNINGSGIPASALARVLRDRFGFKSAKFVLYNIATQSHGEDFAQRAGSFNNALYASLDAKMPVYLSMDGETAAHTFVADGYGFYNGKRYVHMNFGWWGNGDGWYNMDLNSVVDSMYTFDAFAGIGFNIHPTTVGDVISGRVLNSSSSPVSGATVTLYDSANNAKATASTDSKGIYSFRITAAGNYSVKATSGSQVSPSRSVSVAAISQDGSYDYDGRVGNRCGNDLTVAAVAATYKLTCNPNGGKLKGDNFGAHNGTTSSHDITVTYGAASYSTLGTATKDGYTFKGWYTATSGGTQVFNSSGKCVTGTAYWNSSGKWAYQGSLTIYAQWTQNSSASTSNVGFNPNGGTLSGGNFGAKNGTTQTATLVLTYGKGSYNSGMRAARGTGYAFNGFWTAASGGSQIYDANGKYVPNSLCWSSSGTWKHTGNAMLYAQWHTHTVKFDPNGGTLNGGNFGAKNGTTQVASLQVTCGAGAYNSGMRATKSGSAFNGWWTAASGGSRQYDANGKFVANSTCWDANGKWKHHGNAALYAHWAQGTQLTANPYGGKLNGGNFGSDNGTTSSHTVDVTYGGKAFSTLGTATRSGYVFTGWYTNPTGGYMVFDTNGKFVEGDYWNSDGQWNYAGSAVTVYARWVAAGTTYTLTCKPQGGTLKGGNFGSDNGTSRSHDVSVVTGKGSYNVLGTATKDGYKFLGWYSDPTSGSPVFDANGKFVADSWCWNAAGQWVWDRDVTVYARWAEASTLTCNPNGGKLNGGNFGADNGKATTHSVILGKGTSAYSTLGTATRDGYVFMGWYTEDDKPVYDYDGKAWTRSSTDFWYVSDATWKYSGNVTVYAKWESRSSYNLVCYPEGGTLKGGNFGADNGTSNAHDVTVTVGSSSYSTLGTAVRPGYRFTGWYRMEVTGYMQYRLVEKVFDENGKWVPSHLEWGGPWMWSKSGVWMYAGDLRIGARWEKVD